MTDLRKAAEMALEALNSKYIVNCGAWMLQQDQAAEALRQALAHEALDRMVAENQRLGLYDDAAPEVTPEVTPEVPCKTHPDAPHGFNRNASFDEDRYVCDCEFWEPDVDAVNMPKQEYQYEVVAEHADGTYTTRRIPKREWFGLTADEIWKCNKAETGSAVEFHICSAHQNVMDFAEAIEAKLKEKNT